MDPEAMYKKIEQCRICGNTELIDILDLGEQVLTGVFPKSPEQRITSGPLRLVKCVETGEAQCGLLQLQHSYSLQEMYGDNYGYRSGLNSSMVRHLHSKVSRIREQVALRKGDLIVDIGSNDSTLLQAYPTDMGLHLLGIDPTGAKFADFYPAHIKLIPDFFSADSIRKSFGPRKARVITSISMFYDLESPFDFVEQVRDSMADDGIWVAEQSYMPTMLDVNAYDTVCHEHLEYYGLRQIKWMTDRAGLKLLDVELNSVNGGSFSFTAAKRDAPFAVNAGKIQALLDAEKSKRLDSAAGYASFRTNVGRHRDELISFVQKAQRAGQHIVGYGASTKGNVLLQFCGFTAAEIECIAEVNPDKLGAFTPGSRIPIVSEVAARAMKPDYFLVLPWHFKQAIIEKEESYCASGGRLLFPLPSLCTYPE